MGDGTRKMLKFEKKEATTEEANTQQEQKTQQGTATTPTKEEKPSQPEPPTEEKKPVQTTMIPSPNIDKQISKLEIEISKNRDMIKDLENKLENLNKDLDDLVSLYEIVSEQMNPFVGLSKVTKQRLEALEKFTEEFEKIKNRLEDLEMLVGKLPAEKSVSPEPTKETTITTPSRAEEGLDDIIEKALSSIVMENSIDNVIDRFLEEIKNE